MYIKLIITLLEDTLMITLNVINIMITQS